MTNAQLYLAIGVPALLILNNTAIMLFSFSRVESRFDKVEADLRRFWELFGRHDKLLEFLERKL